MSAIYRTLKRLRAASHKDCGDKVHWFDETMKNGFGRKLSFSRAGLVAAAALMAIGLLVVLLCQPRGFLRNWLLEKSSIQTVSPSSLEASQIQATAGIEGSGRNKGENTFQVSLKTSVESAGTYTHALAAGNMARRRFGSAATMGSRAVKTKWLAPIKQGQKDRSDRPVHVALDERSGDQKIAKGYSTPEAGDRPVAEESAPENRIAAEGGSVRLRKDPRRSDTMQIEKVKRPLTVMRLVSKIESAMGAQDMAGAQLLIRELAELKGKRDDYVLKLTAFWHMKQADFDEAALLLLEVLERRPNDLEAGLNMAIIELKGGHIAKAKRRLSKLRDLYPAHETVGKLMQQIGG